MDFLEDYLTFVRFLWKKKGEGNNPNVLTTGLEDVVCRTRGLAAWNNGRVTMRRAGHGTARF